MDRFTGLLGLAAIVAGGYVFSNNRRAIQKRVVFWGLLLQIAFAFLLSVFISKTRTATVLGYLIIILSSLLAGQVIFLSFQYYSTCSLSRRYWLSLPHLGRLKSVCRFFLNLLSSEDSWPSVLRYISELGNAYLCNRWPMMDLA